ncbi:MAG: DUF4143 domain-containing protein [Bacteroidales bacterium]|nr:DUF4143 domain-containing protein [Bacteroidales bacterium]
MSDFTPAELRKDFGRLWENFLLSERLKMDNNILSVSRMYFWRTYDQQEIDLVEETEGKLKAFEIK